MMAIHKHNPNPNILVRSLRKIYKPVGFKKGYNAILSFITLGYLVGFCLSQVRSFNVWGYWATSASAPAPPSAAGPGKPWRGCAPTSPSWARTVSTSPAA